MVPSEGEWVTIAEGAHQLGIDPATLRGAVKRGYVAVHRVHKRLNLVSVDELEKYRREHLGKRTWQHRRDPDYTPSPGALAQRRYRQRRKQQPAAAPTEENDA